MERRLRSKLGRGGERISRVVRVGGMQLLWAK